MKFLRGISFFVATLLVGEVVRRFLMSRFGGAAASRLGRPDLATYEGASAASKDVKKAVGYARSIVEGRASPLPARSEEPRQLGWVGTARDASEMLLAAGAVLKTISEFVREDANLRKRVTRTTNAT
jgi:hypothetical protein